MDKALISLVAASIAFIGSHFAMSHPLRPMLARLGRGGFMGVYSFVSIATLFWMARAFRQAPPADLGGSAEAGWIVATVLTLPALVLFLGSLKGNPALPAPGAEQAAKAKATGVFRVTRHPMLWGFALWAVSHIVLWWSTRTLIVATAILVLALLGAHLQDRKKRVLMGASWDEWESKTSYWPRWSKLLAAGPVLWAIATAVWLLATWAHIGAGGIPAGLWRWIG